MKKWVRLFCILLFTVQANAQHMNENILRVSKCVDFQVDGKGTNSQWDTTDWIALQPLNAEAAYTTRVKILYSQTGIYFLFDNQDQKIVATFDRDYENLWTEDVVEVFLWTDEEYPMYFEYELSPLNFELPILIPKVGKKFYGWLPWHYQGDRKTKHKTSIRKYQDKVTGWTAEFYIPYALLDPLGNVPPQGGTRWRANMYRIDYDREDPVWWSWRPIVNNFHDHELFGTLEFE